MCAIYSNYTHYGQGRPARVKEILKSHLPLAFGDQSIERLQLRHEMTSCLLPYGKKSRSHVESARNGAAATVVQLIVQT